MSWYLGHIIIYARRELHAIDLGLLGLAILQWIGKNKQLCAAATTDSSLGLNQGAGVRLRALKMSEIIPDLISINPSDRFVIAMSKKQIVKNNEVPFSQGFPPFLAGESGGVFGWSVNEDFGSASWSRFKIKSSETWIKAE